MNWLERFFVRRYFKRMVLQGYSHDQRITELYKAIRVASEEEFYEDNVPTLDGFLTECFHRSLQR